MDNGVFKIEVTKIATKIAEFVYFSFATSKFFFHLQTVKRKGEDVVSIVENDFISNILVSKFEIHDLIKHLEP